MFTFEQGQMREIAQQNFSYPEFPDNCRLILTLPIEVK